jgi:hypothetical protein
VTLPFVMRYYSLRLAARTRRSRKNEINAVLPSGLCEMAALY